MCVNERNMYCQKRVQRLLKFKACFQSHCLEIIVMKCTPMGQLYGQLNLEILFCSQKGKVKFTLNFSHLYYTTKHTNTTQSPIHSKWGGPTRTEPLLTIHDNRRRRHSGGGGGGARRGAAAIELNSGAGERMKKPTIVVNCLAFPHELHWARIELS